MHQVIESNYVIWGNYYMHTQGSESEVANFLLTSAKT